MICRPVGLHRHRRFVVMRSVRMSVMSILVGVASLATMTTLAESKTASLKPEYTWNLVALGQGGWIGGPLFDDGSVGGGGHISLNNGQLVAELDPTFWTEDASENISVCFDIHIRKGPQDALPPSLC